MPTDHVVNTSAGPVRGTVEDGIAVFRGIPYAAPPFGDRLWRLPQEPDPWTDPLDCAEYGPVCPQPVMAGAAAIMGVPEHQDEDCLRLNVWAPAGPGGGHPVMVWIHGGAYMIGSGSAPGNQGRTFARDGVVFVSMNYRLGAMGFLHAGALRPERSPGSGNYGIADQVAALRWVRDNIERFGGDPRNVTIFGVSAGGNYTQALTVCPPAPGLFVRAISESAGGTPLFGLPGHVGAAVAELYFKELGATASGEIDLASLTPARLLDAQAALLDAIRTGGYDDRIGDLTVPFYPVASTDYQPKSVIDGHADGDSAAIDLIIGTNRHEMTIFKFMEQSAGSSQMTPRGYVAAEWEKQVAGIDRETEPEASQERLAWTIDGDRGFRIPNLRAAEARAHGGGRTWLYEFAWESPVFDGSTAVTADPDRERRLAWDNIDIRHAFPPPLAESRPA